MVTLACVACRPSATLEPESGESGESSASSEPNEPTVTRSLETAPQPVSPVEREPQGPEPIGVVEAPVDTGPPPSRTRVEMDMTDHDGDGIPSVLDLCPSEPEDLDAFEDDDGCPDVDNDGDGILDIDDQCPMEPETFDGRADDDGCPG